MGIYESPSSSNFGVRIGPEMQGTLTYGAAKRLDQTRRMEPLTYVLENHSSFFLGRLLRHEEYHAHPPSFRTDPVVLVAMPDC